MRAWVNKLRSSTNICSFTAYNKTYLYSAAPIPNVKKAMWLITVAAGSTTLLIAPSPANESIRQKTC